MSKSTILNGIHLIAFIWVLTKNPIFSHSRQSNLSYSNGLVVTLTKRSNNSYSKTSLKKAHHQH